MSTTKAITQIPERLMEGVGGEASLYDRLGGDYGIAIAVDDPVDRLYGNGAANAHPKVGEIHARDGDAGFRLSVTAWGVEQTGGPRNNTGRDMRGSHANLTVSRREFDIIATVIKTLPYHLDVPDREMGEFMANIESWRLMVLHPIHRAA